MYERAVAVLDQEVGGTGHRNDEIRMSKSRLNLLNDESRTSRLLSFANLRHSKFRLSISFPISVRSCVIRGSYFRELRSAISG